VTGIPSGSVGRFYPDHFSLISASVNDSCTGFSYMSHPAMTFGYRLEAQNLTGGITTNYSQPNYASTASVFYAAENLNDGVNLGSRVNVTGSNWVSGVMNVNALNAEFMRKPHVSLAAPAREIDGPLASLQLGLGLTDTLDSRQLQNRNLNAATTGDCTLGNTCTAVAVGTPRILRFGRLRLDDAFGPESVDLPVTFTTEFWSGSFFATAPDSCTQIPRGLITYPAGTIATDGNRTVPLSGGSTQGLYANLQPTTVVFSGGSAGHFFSAPGTGTGNFNVDIDLTTLPWLRFDHNQDGDFNNDMNMRGRYGFGQYRGHDLIIYWREDFQ
jgi:MSHA biogenesis protein MshQ